MNSKKIKIEFDDDWPLLNLLNEITHGFYINNFEGVIGAKKEFVEDLLERLLRDEKNGLMGAFLERSEVEIIKKALNAVEKEIEEWEFQTRIGVTLEETKKILKKIDF